MGEKRKTRKAKFWAIVVLVAVLVGYPLSFGPACWWFATPTDFSFMENGTEYGVMGIDYYAPHVYWPIGWLRAHGPTTLGNAIDWYAGRGKKHCIWIPIDATGACWVTN
jgi:hypothetical protein